MFNKREIIPLVAVMVVIITIVAIVMLGNESGLKAVTPTPVIQIQYIPIVVTAVPEPDIPTDLWRCIQNPTLALDAPDVGLDHNNYDVVDLRVKPIGDKGQLNVYTVFNRARNEARAVTVEWGTDVEGFSTLIRCDVPMEWGNYQDQSPTVTPYVLPMEPSGIPGS